MTLPVVLSEDDLAAIMALACANPCRDERQQAALLAAAPHLDALFVDFAAWAEDTWEWTPCPVCDRPVPREAFDAVCRACREERAEDWAAWEGRVL